MNSVWLIDASTYKKNIPPSILSLKKCHFEIKRLIRYKLLGDHFDRGVYNYSIGLLYIADMLTQANYNVRYYSLFEFDQKLTEEIIRHRPDHIGFYAVTPTVPSCSSLANKAKSINSNIKFSLGGPHALVASESTRKRYPIFNKIVPEYGAKAVREIIGIKSITDLRFRQIPYKILPRPIKTYAHNIVTYHGCSFNCTYCQDNRISYAIPNYIENFRYLNSKLPRKSQVHIADSSLGGSSIGAISVCDRIGQIDHDMILSCDMHLNFINQQVIKGLKKARFSEIRVGVDSFDEEVLKFNNRQISTEDIVSTLKLLREESNLYVSIYLLTGLPGTNKKTIIKNKKFITKLFELNLIDQIKHHLFVPYPRDYDYLSNKFIKIENEDWSAYDRYSLPVYSNKHLTSHEIWENYLETEKYIIDEWRRFKLKKSKTKSFISDHQEYHIFNYF